MSIRLATANTLLFIVSALAGSFFQLTRQLVLFNLIFFVVGGLSFIVKVWIQVFRIWGWL
jgi:hypothetical protein